MADRSGINGGGVALAAGGLFLIYAGVRNVPILDGLRELAAGRLPAPRPAQPTEVGFIRNIGGGAGSTPAKGTENVAATRSLDSLGNVKPHVRAAAAEIGPRFGIKTIYGWAPGTYEHPKGLALDFMTNNIPNGKAVGDALAAYVLQNAARLKVMYVIWYRRSWNPKRGTWIAYSGASAHTDHVHVSFDP